MDQSRNDSSTVGSLRKRPLADSSSSKLDRLPHNGQDTDAMAFSPPPKHPTRASAVLDEVELHFQRSLAQPKMKRSVKEVHSKDVDTKFGTASPEQQEDEEHKNNATSKKIVYSEASLITTNTPTVSSLENIVMVDNREQIVPQKLATPQCIRSPQSDTSFEEVGIMNATTQSMLQKNLQQSEDLPGEMIKVIPSEILDTNNLTHDATSLTGFKTSISGTKSRTVQVVDLTKRSLSDTHVAKNGIASAAAASNSSRFSSLGATSQLPKDLLMNKVSAHNVADKDHVSSRNGTSSTKIDAAVGNPVILVPTSPGNIGSTTLMVQPQPYILVNPTAEMPRVNHPTLIGSPNIYCGGSGFILLSPNNTVPNSLLQVVSSAGVCVPQSGVTTPVVQSSPLTFVSAPKPPVTPLNSTKVARTSFVSDSKKDDINVMPASVEDHFAKALGKQWSKISSGSSNVSSSNTVKS